MPALEIGGDRRGKGISKHKEGIEESSQMPALSIDVDVDAGKVCRKEVVEGEDGVDPCFYGKARR